MVNHIDPALQTSFTPTSARHEPLSLSGSYGGMNGALEVQQPVIEVSEDDGNFNVYADFRPVLDHHTDQVTVKFARQGMILTGGTVQRYLPIPTDALVLNARVTVAEGIARISIPTADAGHRWRSIVMW